ncbi:MAG: MbcA/ParS/Xre antitoxin family protein [Nocardiaceae bacterium]|nr:MbcA/ParS/Xre antitoxin family protein [Nocardiaceae bacterium]
MIRSRLPGAVSGRGVRRLPVGVDRRGQQVAALAVDQGRRTARAVWGAAADRPGARVDARPASAGEAAARTWLESANAHLDGARPIDVLQLSAPAPAPAPVLEALDAEACGGAA